MSSQVLNLVFGSWYYLEGKKKWTCSDSCSSLPSVGSDEVVEQLEVSMELFDPSLFFGPKSPNDYDEITKKNHACIYSMTNVLHYMYIDLIWPTDYSVTTEN